MLDNAFMFGLFASTVITIVSYLITKSGNKSEKEQNDKLNDMVILFITCFVIIALMRVCFDSYITPVTATIVKGGGGQCPF